VITPVIWAPRTFPYTAKFLADLDLALNLSDELEHSKCVTWDVKVWPVEILKLYDASGRQVGETTMRKLEYSFDS